MRKKVSIIIPVYNGEKYLSRCIDSVLGQGNFDVSSLEVILINDGSSDSSGKIIDFYVKGNHDVIRAVHQENAGVAITRNRGIGLARGEYIMFIDQDDWVDCDYCEVFYNAIESSGADVVGGGYTRPDSRGIVRRTSSPRIDTEYSKYIIVAAWAKIHRTSFLKQNKILFFENRFGEDSVFTIKEIYKAKKWQLIDYTGYRWYFNEKSVSNTLQKKLSSQEVESLLILLSKLSSSSGDSENDMFQYYILRTCVYYLLFSGRRETIGNFLSAYSALKMWIDKSVNKSYIFTFNPRGEVFSVKLIIIMFVILHKVHLVNVFARIYCQGRAS